MSALPPLPPGWTENKAPSGHTYYYNAQTKQSTYRRPAAAPVSIPPPPPPPSIPLPAVSQPPRGVAHRPSIQPPFQHSQQHGPQPPFLNLSDPRVANAFMAQHNAASTGHGDRGRGGHHGGRGRGGFNARPRPQPNDKPRSRIPIPGHEPWVLVYTKYGRRFVYHADKNTSYWRIPEKLMPAILEMDKAGIRPTKNTEKNKDKVAQGVTKADDAAGGVVVPLAADYDSEYEEVEVTDDEGGEGGAGDDGGDGDGDDGDDDDAGRRKRQRTQDEADTEHDGPVEFGEDDIAFQLAAANGMTDEQYYDEDGYSEGADDDANEHGDDGAALFKALLDDFKINPFSAWEKLIEEGQVFDDPRYTALPTMKARKSVWEEWSRDRIREKKQKEEAVKQEKKKDPKAAYLQLLQDLATPKLYWAEFKRKYRKEPAMKDALHPPDKEKEKLYRDYVARRKLPAATRKADLLKLLESLPRPAKAAEAEAEAGGGSSDRDRDLPPELTSDLRYVAVEPAVRDPLVDAFYKSA